ncbi:DUF4402 domain-containing protein [Shewanella sp.]|uniref:DUF4402 domain-containing protein n=1 Tax=Shewanella sp. TaxID=50422 RepID=UPI001EB6958D|nr:DUF4402 domain-containing protein [Shewanella sp.]NRB23577.1 DUF4402 domain-containing protein [Shewanella sp.]
MTNVKTLSKVIAIALLAAGSTQATAEETAPSTATVKVQNAFDLAQVTGIDFGTIRVTSDIGTATATAEVATVTIYANGDSPSADSKVKASAQVIVDGAAATYTIAKVAPFSKLELTLPADDAVTLKAASAPSETSNFLLSGFEAYITSGANKGKAYAAKNLAADSEGNVTFSVGATLKTDKRGTEGAITAYVDGDYTGTFDVVVSY